MKWLDPKVWEDDHACGRDSLEFLANHFAIPLSVTRFNHNNRMEKIQNLHESKF